MPAFYQRKQKDEAGQDLPTTMSASDPAWMESGRRVEALPVCCLIVDPGIP
jgi:hypothetical protein